MSASSSLILEPVSVVQVEDEVIDPKAPYYQLVMQCAAIKGAVVDDTVAGETSSLTASELSGADSANKEAEGQDCAVNIVVGQRIIIPGNMTPTFIPPSGIDVVQVQQATTKPRILNPKKSSPKASRAAMVFQKTMEEVGLNATIASSETTTWPCAARASA
jgi:hypothetical protein